MGGSVEHLESLGEATFVGRSVDADAVGLAKFLEEVVGVGGAGKLGGAGDTEDRGSHESSVSGDVGWGAWGRGFGAGAIAGFIVFYDDPILVFFDGFEGMDFFDDVFERSNVATVEVEVCHVLDSLWGFGVFEDEGDQGIPDLFGAHSFDGASQEPVEGGRLVRGGFCGEGLGQHEGLLEGAEVVVVFPDQLYEAAAKGAGDGIFGVEKFLVVILVEGRAHHSEPHAGGDGTGEGGVLVGHDPGRELFEAIGGLFFWIEAHLSAEGAPAFHQFAGIAVGVLVIIGELDAAGALLGFDAAGGVLADRVAEEVEVMQAGGIVFLFGGHVDEESSPFEEVEAAEVAFAVGEGGEIVEVDAFPSRAGVVVALGALHSDSQEGPQGVGGVVEGHADVAGIVVGGSRAGPSVATGREQFPGHGFPAFIVADGLPGPFDEGGVGAEVSSLQFHPVESQVVVEPVVHVALIAFRLIEPGGEVMAFVCGGIVAEFLDLGEGGDASDGDERGAPEEGGIIDGSGCALLGALEHGADERVELRGFFGHVLWGDLGSRKGEGQEQGSESRAVGRRQKANHIWGIRECRARVFMIGKLSEGRLRMGSFLLPLGSRHLPANSHFTSKFAGKSRRFHKLGRVRSKRGNREGGDCFRRRHSSGPGLAGLGHSPS